jgi:hypothetical protein
VTQGWACVHENTLEGTCPAGRLVARVWRRYPVGVVHEPLRLTITYEEPDEDGWIVASVLEVPGALSQGRSREERVRTSSMRCV